MKARKLVWLLSLGLICSSGKCFAHSEIADTGGNFKIVATVEGQSLDECARKHIMAVKADLKVGRLTDKLVDSLKLCTGNSALVKSDDNYQRQRVYDYLLKKFKDYQTADCSSYQPENGENGVRIYKACDGGGGSSSRDSGGSGT